MILNCHSTDTVILSSNAKEWILLFKTLCPARFLIKHRLCAEPTNMLYLGFEVCIVICMFRPQS